MAPTVRWSDAKVSRLRRYCDEGMAARAISEAMGLPVESVRAKAVRCGFSLASQSRSSKERVWTEQMLLRLRAMVQDGFTGSQMAKELPFSRGAIIGMANRLSLRIGGSGGTKSAVQVVARIKERQRVAKNNTASDPVVSGGIDFFSLRFGVCRRPLWADFGAVPPPSEQRYCGEPTVDVGPYCPSCSPRMVAPKILKPKTEARASA